MQEIPLALRFIVKSAAFMAHHQHLKPESDFDVLFFSIPHNLLIFIHSLIGFILMVLLLDITRRSVIAIVKNVWGWKNKERVA